MNVRIVRSRPIVHQRIGRTYGVSGCPATVSVDTGGRVEHIQFGRARGQA